LHYATSGRPRACRAGAAQTPRAAELILRAEQTQAVLPVARIGNPLNAGG
jgi:hypothetical protein